jgi:hypothetical protein
VSVQTTSVKVEDATPGSAIRVKVDDLGGEVVSVRSELEVEVFGDVVVSAAE